MLLLTLLAIAAVFGLLLLGRIGGARRVALMRQWPAVLLAGAALLAVVRGAIPLALGLAVASLVAWVVTPAWSHRRRAASAPKPDPGDAEARTILGVGPTATESEIRSAYRAKMASAHPDRGGKHAEAARLTAARDRLLKKRRG
jgi:hypothetical protein